MAAPNCTNEIALAILCRRKAKMWIRMFQAALASPQRRWRHRPTPRIRRRPGPSCKAHVWFVSVLPIIEYCHVFSSCFSSHRQAWNGRRNTTLISGSAGPQRRHCSIWLHRKHPQSGGRRRHTSRHETLQSRSIGCQHPDPPVGVLDHLLLSKQAMTRKY